jgi:Mrp family chromosome partitioning ATPase
MPSDNPLSETPLLAYARAVRAHWLLVLVVTLVAVGGGYASAELRSPRYEATADLLVTPVPHDNRALLGIDVIRDAGDPTRTVQTAAALVDARGAAELAAAKLPGWTPDRVLDATQVNPRGETNVLAVTAEADEPELAAQVATQLAESAVATRTDEVLGQVNAAIRRLRARRGRRGPGPQRLAEQRAERLAELQAVKDRGSDPTLSLLQGATSPTSAVGAPLALILVVAGFIGLALGVGAAMVIELLSKRIRDEDELLRLYPLPLLARIGQPKGRRARGRAALASSPATREAFRTVGAQLDSARGGPRSIMVMSASPGDGKTTAVANLAVALRESGHSVVAIDLSRRPELAHLLGDYVEQAADVEPGGDGKPAERELEATNASGLRVVAGSAESPEWLSLEGLAQARASGADFVLLDIDSLGEVSDALRFAPYVDEVILVARVGHTERRRFELARDLLERIGARPFGLLEFDRSELAAAEVAFANGSRPEAPSAESKATPGAANGSEDG